LYRVIVVRVLYETEEDAVAKQHASAIVEKEFSLPFVPFKGLHISWGAASTGALQTIQWDVQDKTFYCSVDGCQVDMIQNYIHDGWSKK